MTIDTQLKKSKCPFSANTQNKEHFTPPYPTPHKNKNSLLKRFITGQISWLNTLFEKSYTMKMGEIKLPKLNFFITNESALVKKILIDDVDNFPKHSLLETLLGPLTGHSIFTVSGNEWKKQRKMVYPAFTHATLKSTYSLMLEATEDLITEIKRRIDIGHNKQIYIDPLMTFVTADIIYRTLFSLKITQQDSDIIYHAFNDYQVAVQPCTLLKIYGLPTWYHKYKVKKATSKIHAILSPIIKARYKQFHQSNQAGNDILGALLQAKDAETNEHFSIQELINQISTIFLAGHETSASTLTWALYLLAETPEIQQECRAQIPNKRLCYTDLKTLSGLYNIFHETLRLYPPVAFFLREANCPMTLRQKNISKNSMIVISPWLIHRNKNNWDNPHQFKPNRFDDKHFTQVQKDAYLPFGKGPRTCIGAGFAKQEALIILAEILKNFNLSYTNSKKPEPISRVTLRPKNGIYLNVEKLK